jgi:hypothetical protein
LISRFYVIVMFDIEVLYYCNVWYRCFILLPHSVFSFEQSHLTTTFLSSSSVLLSCKTEAKLIWKFVSDLKRRRSRRKLKPAGNGNNVKGIYLPYLCSTDVIQRVLRVPLSRLYWRFGNRICFQWLRLALSNGLSSDWG